MHCGEFGIKRNSYAINTGDTPRDRRNVPKEVLQLNYKQRQLAYC